MQSVLRLAALALLALGPVAVCADPLVTVTASGNVHNGDDPYSFSFSFDPAAYHTSDLPGYAQDYLYAISPVNVFGLGTLDALDINDGGDSFQLYVAAQFGTYQDSILVQYQSGTCQSLPVDPRSGIAPVFVATRCSAEAYFSESGAVPPENLDGLMLDFSVQPGAATPEPPTGLLLCSGLLLLGALCCRSRLPAR